MFSLIFPVIAPVLIAAAIGYTWARMDKPFDTNTVTNLVLTVGVPMLVIDVLINANITPAAMGDMAVAAVVALVGSALAGVVMLKATGQPIRAFLPSMIFGNTGNMALPLCLFAFGEEGLALAIGYFTVTIVVQVSATTLISSTENSWKTAILNPMAWAAILALILKFGGFALPTWIANTVHLLGGMTIPIMLLALGVSLARLRIASLGRSLFLGAGKIALGFGLGYAVVLALGLEGPARGVVLVQTAMPVAVFNYLFAAKYNQRPEEVAGVVILSTLTSFLTLPLLLWFAMDGVVSP
jgi:predicted permease